ncbi:glycosyltransferase [Aliarcobacter lanthieri]|uniref:glycosyltransferase n=1 Tax=Aliarcobacter lanthieri TaxID=1355374 RepID=UPI003AAE2472
MEKNKIICLNLDTIKNKNIYQFDEMSKFGYSYICCGYLNDKSNINSSYYKYYKYPKSIIARVKFIFKLLLKNKNSLSHIELYTGGGSFLAIEYLMAKLLFIKVCVVERGSPLRDLNSYYKFFPRISRKYIYKNAIQVWIRELWMKDALYKLKRDNYFFLSNAISIPIEFSHSYKKQYDFIWCNSFIKWRNIDWFIDNLNKNNFSNNISVVLGMLENNKTTYEVENYVKINKPKKCTLLNFQNPKEYFLNSKFFILPADIVYLNFALLEAMSYGVVPIVSDVEGTREIVDDGINGIIANHSKEGLEEAMTKAINMSDDEYEIMSKNARIKVIEKFSVESWAKKLNTMYENLK